MSEEHNETVHVETVLQHVGQFAVAVGDVGWRRGGRGVSVRVSG